MRSERNVIAGLGGKLLENGKTWVIPDGFKDINPFMTWLPKQEGFFVQRPHFVMRGKWPCWKCGKETPVVTLGAKRYQSLIYETMDQPVWREEEGPLVFTHINYLDGGIRQSLQSCYPFLQKRYSRWVEGKVWGNCCVHCHTFQESDGDYVLGFANPFSPSSPEEARGMRVIFFKLEFDYYIRAGYELNPFYEFIP